MCGIAGEVNWRGAVDSAAAERMALGIAHRGPDDEGTWTEVNRRCVLVHRRLSILDLSVAGHQPMVDPATGNVLVFNGEIYNFRELRALCERSGEVFHSESDTEVILVLYRMHGELCLSMLRGMFAFALWDARRERMVLARDRFGKKPLNYAVTNHGVVFCSEIHPLSRHPAVDRAMDLDALDLYLQLQSIPAPFTIYQAIRKLPPAHFAIIDRDGARIERYWSLDYRDKLRITENEALEEFETILTEAVRIHMLADVPLGALLSGGVDSSVVVALMSKIARAPVHTFTIGFDEQRYDEMPFAQQVADICQTDHHPELVAGNAEATLPMLARHYGEPYADSSAIPSFCVSRVARQHVAVVLNGDGGDELLGGYGHHCAPNRALRTGNAISGWLGPDRLARLIPLWANAASPPTRALRRFAHDYVNPEFGGLLMLSGYWNDRLRDDLRPGLGSGKVGEWRRDRLREAFAHASNPLDRMLWLEMHTNLSNDLLVKMDIASMHCGLEARSPLLDHVLVEFCARLPVAMKTRGRTGKYLLKKLAEKYFSADFVHRRKMGFGIPVATWLRGPLKAHVENVILDPATMAPLEMKAVRSSWDRLLHSSGARLEAEAGRVWALLMYGQWRRLDA